MCDTITNELGRLVASLNHRHVDSTTAVVVLIYMTTYLFTHYGESHRVYLMLLLAAQRRAVGVFMARQGVGSGKLDEALANLSRANATVAYLEGLPG